MNLVSNLHIYRFYLNKSEFDSLECRLYNSNFSSAINPLDNPYKAYDEFTRFIGNCIESIAPKKAKPSKNIPKGKFSWWNTK